MVTDSGFGCRGMPGESSSVRSSTWSVDLEFLASSEGERDKSPSLFDPSSLVFLFEGYTLFEYCS